MLPISNDPGFPSVFCSVAKCEYCKKCVGYKCNCYQLWTCQLHAQFQQPRTLCCFLSSALPLHPILSLLLHGEEDLLPQFECIGSGWVLFSSILWCSQTCNHPQEELPKFGYRSGRNVEIWSRWSKSDCGFCWNGCQQLIWEAVEPSCCWEEHSWVHSQGIRSTIHTYIHTYIAETMKISNGKQTVDQCKCFVSFLLAANSFLWCFLLDVLNFLRDPKKIRYWFWGPHAGQPRKRCRFEML